MTTFPLAKNNWGVCVMLHWPQERE